MRSGNSTAAFSRTDCKTSWHSRMSVPTPRAPSWSIFALSKRAPPPDVNVARVGGGYYGPPERTNPERMAVA